MKRIAVVAVAAVLSMSCLGWGAISYDPSTFTLAYGSPADLDSVVDPAGLKDVQASFGMTKQAFQALNPQVVGFNAATQANPGPDQNLKTVVATFSTGKSVQFKFPAVKYNYGGKTSQGRSAFSGTAAYCDISTYETQPTIPGQTPPATGWNAWLEVTIDTTAAASQGVSALGFCVCSHNIQNYHSGPGTAYFVLSDGMVSTVDYPKFGGDDPTQAIFIGYQAPADKTITAVYCTRPGSGNSFIAIDDLAFVMTEPATSLAGDINGDGFVNVGDLQLLVAAWANGPGHTGPEDINGDGYVNVGDLQVLVTNWGASSVDTTAPAAVTNLVAGSPTTGSLTLTWTAPGDDGSAGRASSYDIRYRTGGPVDESNWGSATQVPGEPTPAVAGTVQSHVVTGLLVGTTYYFAIKTSDEVSLTSLISNSPNGTTAQGKTLLTPRDFKYKGYYRVQGNIGGPNSSLNAGCGFTHRYVGGQLRFLTMGYWGPPEDVRKCVEFAPPASGLGGTVTARTNLWQDLWAGMDNTYVGQWISLWYEASTDRLWTNAVHDYIGYDTTKVIAYRTLNSNGTISGQNGPWALQGVQQRRIYGGMQAVPTWFQSAYGVGPYCAGWGGYASTISYGYLSLGPVFYTFADPAGYPTGENGIPTSAYKDLMHAASVGSDWYANGFPTTFDRGLRNCDVINDYDTPHWQSPAPDGLGRWTWGDSNWNTGCWIETPDNKHGFIMVPKLNSGRTWYQYSTLNAERMTAEIHVYDPYMLGEVALGTRANGNTHPTYRWQITDVLRPLGYGSPHNGPYRGPCGASYDSTTQTLYIYCMGPAGTTDSYILVYDVGLQQAVVEDGALGETAVTGTLGTTAPHGPANWSNTETKDGIYQTVTEVVLSNTSQLERKWTFNVTAGSSVVFNLKSYKTSNTESDNFVFAYSTNGTNWTNMVTVTRTTDDGTYQTYNMPGGTSGTVYVRVQDTDRTAGRNNLDTIYIDQMFFLSNP